ncbi:Tryptophan--tRNA ligase, mitochondrial [Lachnellula cervina]|uniref:Small ribosomal subunit protein uS10m n=1 Tax=Lachnellula cervina TaxID=1316786 RepID=A0A7D8UNY7_9HELO|nr:Tryptophan--tRNA ligase, mitochondrial [Lachnellula cervina]
MSKTILTWSRPPAEERPQYGQYSERKDLDFRLPRSVQAVYLRPLKRQAEYGVPSCDLQMRSYNVRNLEFFSDFALRAAYYLGLPASGPVPLPRILERWTVPRGSFIHKKSQENFERRTVRRLIQIKDGNPETVGIWLAFLRKHAYYGIGMKANVFEFSKLGVGKSMDIDMEHMKDTLDKTWGQIGVMKDKRGGPTADKIMELVNKEDFRAATHGNAPMVRPPVIFSGIQPTGVPHLGNYLGALQQWVRLQNTAHPSTKLLYSIVDLHAITVPQDPEFLRQWKRETLATLLAIGLDPNRSILFYQSSVSAHSELMWILSCTASMGYLSRMTQWKSKLQLKDDASPLDEGSKSKLKLGLFSYPVLQAADILVHRATHVPVGEDQSQHLEFARECVTNFNHAYGPNLVAPLTIMSPAKRVMSLQDPHLKMSKSHSDPRSRILITDPPDVIHKKMMAALTDSTNSVSYDPENRPGVSNLLQLLSHFNTEGKSAQELGLVYANFGLGQFKKAVAESISESLAPIRTKYEQVLAADGGRYLDHVWMQGAVKAKESADATMEVVRRAVGL